MTPRELIECDLLLVRWERYGEYICLEGFPSQHVWRCPNRTIADHLIALHNASLRVPLTTAQQLRGVGE